MASLVRSTPSALWFLRPSRCPYAELELSHTPTWTALLRLTHTQDSWHQSLTAADCMNAVLYLVSLLLKCRGGWVLLALTAPSNPAMRVNGDQMETFESSASQIFFWQKPLHLMYVTLVFQNEKLRSDFLRNHYENELKTNRINSKPSYSLNMKHLSPKTKLSGLCHIYFVCQGKCYLLLINGQICYISG